MTGSEVPPDPSTPALRGARVLLGVTGGIAAYKAASLARLLVGAGAIVDVVLTPSAERFVGAATFEGLTGRPVGREVWDDVAAGTHVSLGRVADVVLVYPATAHTIARLAGGLADDLLTNALLVTRAPVLVAPAMHTEMYEHPATQTNLATLRARGVHVVGPDVGALMGGDVGAGRVVEPEAALAAVVEVLPARAETPGALTAAPSSPTVAPGALAGRRVVVTAGGTREPVDPVRYLGNRSSGKMGYAVAAAAARRGAQVDLVSAPTGLAVPAGVTRHDITTACELRDAVFALLEEGVDVVVKAAAVADFRPAQVADQKLKKAAGPPTIVLVRNPDVLAELGDRRRELGQGPVLVGFAAETEDVEANGRAKLAAKGADLLVVNDVSATDAGFEVDTNRVVLLTRDGGRTEVPLASKAAVADRILDAVVTLLGATEPAGAAPDPQGVATAGHDGPGTAQPPGD